MTDAALVAMVALPVVAAALLALAPSPRAARRMNAAFAVLVAAGAAGPALAALLTPDAPLRGRWFVVDPAGGVFLLVIAGIGAASALASPGWLAALRTGFFAGGGRRPRAAYFAAFYLFWAALLATAVVDNLAVASLLIEATTAASALLVGFSGRPHALEAGWKYLVLTSLGLAVALLGLVGLYAGIAPDHGSLATLDWTSIHAAAPTLGHATALTSLALLLAGLATKIGWAPVHAWLPDAHSEAPPPVSALLSAALLPTVMLVAWRVQVALHPAVAGVASGLFLAFGLASLAVAVPFLWRPLPLKRLLAYSSLEHMGVLALGMGFATPLATAGVVLHLAGHAVAKSLGFYASIPLLRADPGLAARPPRGLADRTPGGAAAVGVSLGSLGGLPPSPLFFSELFILLGGVAAGELAVAATAAVLLALGFLGLAHAAIEGVAGDAPPDGGPASPPGPAAGRRLGALTAAMGTALLGLSVVAAALPGSSVVTHLMGGVA